MGGGLTMAMRPPPPRPPAQPMAPLNGTRSADGTILAAIIGFLLGLLLGALVPY